MAEWDGPRAIKSPLSLLLRSPSALGPIPAPITFSRSLFLFPSRFLFTCLSLRLPISTTVSIHKMVLCRVADKEDEPSTNDGCKAINLSLIEISRKSPRAEN